MIEVRLSNHSLSYISNPPQFINISKEPSKSSSTSTTHNHSDLQISHGLHDIRLPGPFCHTFYPHTQTDRHHPPRPPFQLPNIRPTISLQQTPRWNDLRNGIHVRQVHQPNRFRAQTSGFSSSRINQCFYHSSLFVSEGEEPSLPIPEEDESRMYKGGVRPACSFTVCSRMLYQR